MKEINLLQGLVDTVPEENRKAYQDVLDYYTMNTSDRDIVDAINETIVNEWHNHRKLTKDEIALVEDCREAIAALAEKAYSKADDILAAKVTESAISKLLEVGKSSFCYHIRWWDLDYV